MTDTALIDRIYECSFVPELWPRVLDELAQIADTMGGVLILTDNTKVLKWVASPIFNDGMEAYIRDGWFARGRGARSRLFAARHAGFLTEYDLATDEELDANPYYRDFRRPSGLGWCAATAVPLPTADMLLLTLHRQYARGPVERAIVNQLDELRPHLARSALMSARLQLERARVASESLAALGLPALVLDDQGKVLGANYLAESLDGCIRWRAQDRLSLKDKSADRLLRNAIATIDMAGGGMRSFPVRDTGAEAIMVAHVIPIRLSARDIFVRCAATLVLTPVTLPHAPPIELVQSLFDLTPAEARIAHSLAAGETVETIACAQGVSQSTIRAHVRGVLEKTGCRRQVDVVSLLTAISPARLTALT
jgi:DNA-binding CsgD family transcriptional regulator